MKLLLVSCLSLLAASPALSKCLGSITVKDYGEVFIVAPDWSADKVEIHHNGFTFRGNAKMYFASRCEDGWSGDMYAQLPLDNRIESLKRTFAKMKAPTSAFAFCMTLC